jgi:hypothetical protein
MGGGSASPAGWGLPEVPGRRAVRHSGGGVDVRPWVMAALMLAVAGVAASCSSGGASPGGTPEPGSGPLPAAAPAGPVPSPAPSSSPGGRPAAPAPSAADLAWLRGVEELGSRLDAVLARSPGAMTRQTLRSLAGQLRECTRELVRLGAPSERLRPVRALVERACGEYEKGAGCFTAAADSRSASGVQSRLDCGFAAVRRGGAPLAAAAAEARELRAAG